MRINVRAAGIALAAAVGILAFSGAAQAASNVGNSGLINTDTINALNVQACNSPVTAVIGVTADLASPRAVDNCVNGGGQVGGTTGGHSNVANSGLVNTGDINAGNIQLCNSPVTAGIAANAAVVSPKYVDNCVNSGATVGASHEPGHKNVGNQGLLLNTSDVNAANGQLCNSSVTGGIGLDVPLGSPSVAPQCVNSGAHVPGATAYKGTAAKPVAVKKATPVKATKKTVKKVTPVPVKASKK